MYGERKVTGVACPMITLLLVGGSATKKVAIRILEDGCFRQPEALPTPAILVVLLRPQHLLMRSSVITMMVTIAQLVAAWQRGGVPTVPDRTLSLLSSRARSPIASEVELLRVARRLRSLGLCHMRPAPDRHAEDAPSVGRVRSE